MSGKNLKNKVLQPRDIDVQLLVAHSIINRYPSLHNFFCSFFWICCLRLWIGFWGSINWLFDTNNWLFWVWIPFPGDKLAFSPQKSNHEHFVDDLTEFLDFSKKIWYYSIWCCWIFTNTSLESCLNLSNYNFSVQLSLISAKNLSAATDM